MLMFQRRPPLPPVWACLVTGLLLVLCASTAQAQRIPSRFFAQSSSWYQPVPASPVIHPNSAAMITTIVNSTASLGAITTGFAVPIYYASASDPTVTISNASAAAINLGWHILKIPTNAKQSGFGAVGYRDGHMVIVSPDRTYVTDFYQANKNSDTSWSAGKLRKWFLNGMGMNSPYDALASTRLCATTSLAHGVITYEEIQRGFIDHAVMVAVNTQSATYFAPYPCEASIGGNSPNANAPQAGMRLQLNPAVDVEALALNNTSKIVARAIRDYGMIIVDQAGASDFDVYFEDLSFRTDGAAWATVGAPALGNIPKNQLRVVESPFVADPAGFQVTTTTATPYYWTPFDLTNFFRGTIGAGTTGTRLSQPVTIGGTLWWFVDYPPQSGHTYGWSRAADFSGAPVATPDPPVALQAKHTCGTAANTLQASVLGSLFYLGTPSAYNATRLVESSCASEVAFTDVASVLAGSFSAVRPFHWLGTAGPNTGNTCTRCLAVHQGSASTNDSGSGWTLDTFREGATLAAATSGTSAFTLLPGLCTQVIDGAVTTTPLWPWPMEQRIQAARTLAGRPPVNVTSDVASLLGPIPQACLSTPVVPPQATWFLATTGTDGAACTIAAPCATIAHVAARMSGGHTLYFRGGAYAQRIPSGLIPGGTSWAAPTVLAAYGEETAILQMSTDVLARFGSPATDRYIVLDRLTLDGNASAGGGSNNTNGLYVTGGAGPIRFQNGTVRNTRYERVLVDSGQGVEVLNSVITTGTETPAVSVKGTSDGFLLQDSLVTLSPARGIELSGTLTNARISRTTVHSNAGVGLWLGAGGVTLDNILAYGNSAGAVVTANCLACAIYNSTFADNAGEELQIDIATQNAVVTNTLAVGGILNNAVMTVLTTNLTTDPGFVGSGNYRLASPDSPAADAGTCLPGVVDVALDGVARPQPPGGACDIGAFEMAGGAPLPTPGALSAAPCCGALHFLVP